ncbi:MoeB/ThiF family adenylyltransferase [Peribacillus kribbensis]|uniref:MoeB/ThiF family adenylyltransferase n=1 Tax=Peribacillus kribbensis TaxID=356658 RepID=UPI0003FADF8D|nr:MoeB/ThiF family adenylyltransferase [Peribacillus kribbensis]
MSERYSRQVLFSGIGPHGQEKLKASHVLIIGAGALGAANSEVLVRAGIGKLTIVDRDYVEESNLQRQQLYTEQDVHKKYPKAAAAKRHLEEINSEAEIHAFVMDAVPQSLELILQDVDLIIDAADNFETRLMVNDLAHKHKIPWIYGACVGSFGMSFTILPGKTPCLNCLLRTIPMQGINCDTAGIIGPAVQMTVAHQTAEALKILVGDWDAVRTTFVSFDLWNSQYQSIKAGRAKRDDCLTCGSDAVYPYLQAENTTKTAVLCGRETVQVRPPALVQLELKQLAGSLNAQGYDVKANPYLVSAENDGERIVVFKDGRALIHGTKDVVYAKSLYQKLLG